MEDEGRVEEEVATEEARWDDRYGALFMAGAQENVSDRNEFR